MSEIRNVKIISVEVIASDYDGNSCGKRIDMKLSDAENLLIEMQGKSIVERAELEFTKRIMYDLDLNELMNKYGRTVTITFNKGFVEMMQLKYPQYKLDPFLFGVIIYEPTADDTRTLLN